MKFLKNRTTLGILCIVISLIICFVVTPFFSKSLDKKVQVIRVKKDIQAGEQITEGMVQTVDVGSYNLPIDAIKSTELVVGKYAAKEMQAGDYIFPAKISDTPSNENSYLYSLNGQKQAISVAIKNFSAGLSGKLRSGDIVSVIAPDYRGLGETVILPELKYVEVIAVTASTGNDANTEHEQKNGDEKELPSTVTLLVSPEQSKVLAELDSEGKLHIALVYRGTLENSKKFIKVQDNVIEEIYHAEEEKIKDEEGGIENKEDVNDAEL